MGIGDLRGPTWGRRAGSARGGQGPRPCGLESLIKVAAGLISLSDYKLCSDRGYTTMINGFWTKGKQRGCEITSVREVIRRVNTSATETHAFPAGHLCCARQPTRKPYPPCGLPTRLCAHTFPGRLRTLPRGDDALACVYPGRPTRRQAQSAQEWLLSGQPLGLLRSFSPGSSPTAFLCDEGQVSRASLTSCVTLGKSLHLSMGHFPRWGDKII